MNVEKQTITIQEDIWNIQLNEDERNILLNFFGALTVPAVESFINLYYADYQKTHGAANARSIWDLTGQIFVGLKA